MLRYFMTGKNRRSISDRAAQYSKRTNLLVGANNVDEIINDKDTHTPHTQTHPQMHTHTHTQANQ